MRGCFILAVVVLLGCVAYAQQPSCLTKSATQSPEAKPADSAAKDDDSALKSMFEGKIKAEWDAIKNRDKKAYGEFLADDYEGVEVDDRGERTKLQAIGEMTFSNIANYTLFGFKVTPLNPDAAFLIYEVTMQFPPQSVLPYSRVYVGSLWVKRGAEWKELHYQETHVK